MHGLRRLFRSSVTRVHINSIGHQPVHGQWSNGRRQPRRSKLRNRWFITPTRIERQPRCESVSKSCDFYAKLSTIWPGGDSAGPCVLFKPRRKNKKRDTVLTTSPALRNLLIAISSARDSCKNSINKEDYSTRKHVRMRNKTEKA